MADSPSELVDPRLLVWARTRQGLSVEALAKSVGVPADRVTAWESGVAFPTLPQLRKLAEACKRPLSVFFLPEPPTDFDVLQDFRRLAGSSDRQRSAGLCYAEREAHELRLTAIELTDSLGDPPEPFALRANESDDVVELARRVRTWLAVPLDEQLKWRDPDKALAAWRRAMEARDVLVYQFGKVETLEARGFSIPSDRFPVVGINGKDAATGRSFTILHELGHLMLRVGALCDLEGGAVESFCNEFAGEFLVPWDSLVAQPEAQAQTGPRWSEEALKALARRYSVSEEVILRRLLEHGRTTKAFYEERRAIYAARVTAKSTSAKIPFARKVLARLGRRFVRLALTAYDQQAITINEVAGILGTKVKQLPKFEEYAFGDRA